MGNRKKWKQIGFAVLILCVVLAAAGIGIGNYFVGYALKRSSSSGSRNVKETIEPDESAQTVLEENRKRLAQETEQWLIQVQEETEAVSLISGDGLKLQGTYVSQKDSHRWALLIHGYKSDRHSMEKYGMEYSQNGYQVLMPDNRACGDSEGTYLGMGWLDKEDIKLWIQWIIDRDPQAKIVLHGISMGGAAVMMVSGDPLPYQVIGFVEDCGYTSVWDIFSSELKLRFSLPAFPIMDISSWYAGLTAGYSFREASALKQLAANERPMLFIHGAQDDFVPTDMVYTLYEAADCEKELYVAEGAGHAEALTADPEKYWETIFDFLNAAKIEEAF